MMGFNLETIKNQWIKIDIAEIEKFAAKQNGLTLSDQQLNQMTDLQKQMQDQMKNQLQQILSTAKINKVKNTLPDEVVGGQNTYHYLVVLDKDELKNVIKQFFNVVLSSASFPGVVLPPDFDSEIDKLLGTVGDINYEVWVGQNDGEIHKIKIIKDIDINKLDAKQNGTISFNLEIDYSGINQPVQISEPASSKTLQEMFPQLFNLKIR